MEAKSSIAALPSPVPRLRVARGKSVATVAMASLVTGPRSRLEKVIQFSLLCFSLPARAIALRKSSISSIRVSLSMFLYDGVSNGSLED